MGTKEKKVSIFFGWWIVIAATIVVCSYGSMFYGFGTLFPAILEEFKWSRTLTSSVYSFQLAITSIFMLVMGYLVDRYSPRTLIAVGALFMVIGYLLSIFTNKIWHLYLLFGLIIGIGASAMYVPPVTVVTRWFVKRRGLAVGIVVTGIGIGGALGTPFLNWLIENFGWKMALPILGVSLGCFLLPAAYFLRGYPEDKGLAPYGSILNPESLRKDSIDMAPASNRQHIENASRDWTVWQAIKTSTFCNLYIMLFIAELCLVGVMAHLFTYAVENGISRGLVSISYSCIGITSLVAKIGAGMFSDRIGIRPIFFLSFLLQSVSFIILSQSPNVIFLFIFSVLFGLAYGSWTPLFPTAMSDFFGLRSMGKLFSILTTNFFTGSICGPIFVGWIYDKTNEYFYAYIIFSVLCLMGAFISLYIKPPKPKE
jgi:MFS family permease